MERVFVWKKFNLSKGKSFSSISNRAEAFPSFKMSFFFLKGFIILRNK